MYKVTQMLLSPNEYSRPQTLLKQITKIALHYVGDAGASALAIHNYFEKLKNGLTYISKGKTLYRFASSHYIIGLQGEVIQNIPENEISYCTNSANPYSISIEVCHPEWDGKYTEATYNTMIELSANLCKKYKLNPKEDLIRHYDVTKKRCPRWFVDYPDEWIKFKEIVFNQINNKQESSDEEMVMDKVFVQKKKITATSLNVREKPESTAKDLGDLLKDQIIEITGQIGKWLRISFNNQDAFIHGDYVSDYIEKDYKAENESLKKLNSELISKISLAKNILS
jgi:N-acetylmuramoyl-L-alanine amidase CwlA